MAKTFGDVRCGEQPDKAQRGHRRHTNRGEYQDRADAAWNGQERQAEFQAATTTRAAQVSRSDRCRAFINARPNM
jgi:hypothetical protein